MFFRLYNNVCGKHQSHFYLPIYRLTLFMRRNTSSTQMEGKEEGRGVDKDTFLSLFVRGQEADSADLVSSMLSV